MRKTAYILIFLTAMFSQGCIYNRASPKMVVHKNVPFPKPRSYYSLWVADGVQNKENSIEEIDKVMIMDNAIPRAMYDEWMRLSFAQKSECIEDFFYRRKDALICRYASESPYNKYMRSHFSGDFIDEFIEIMSLSPQIKEMDKIEEAAVYTRDIKDTFERKKEKDIVIGYSGEKQYYEEVSEDAGFIDSGKKETFIKDVRDKLKK